MEDAKVGVSERLIVLWQIGQFSYEDVHKHFEVVGIEIMRRLGEGEKQIQELEYEQLHAVILDAIAGRSVEHEDEVLSKGLGYVES